MFYVTTPIYYVNDVPHIGHAYTTVAGDVLTRWHRQRGEDVWFLTGTDEHGEKILTAAEQHGMTPQQWTDHMVETAWLPALQTIDAANDDFIRTTEARHEDRVRDFWLALREKGEVYRGPTPARTASPARSSRTRPRSSTATARSTAGRSRR